MQPETHLREAPPAVHGIDTGDSLHLASEYVAEHMRLVYESARLIHRTLPKHIELGDLVSAGTVGLVEASNRYNPKRHNNFRAFASTRIRGAILDSLRELDWGNRELRRRGRAIEEAIAKCTARLTRQPQEDEIAHELGVSLLDFQKTLSSLHDLKLGSLQAVNGSTAEEAIDFVIDPDEPGALVLCLRAELRALISESLDVLPDRERLVLALYYYEGLTNGEIADVMDVSPGRVAQLRTAAMLRLRVMLSEHSIGRVSL